ncbi:polysaccharide lyase family 3 protein, partial [Sphaerulina musiva SO2202]
MARLRSLFNALAVAQFCYAEVAIPKSAGYTALSAPKMIKGANDFKMWEFDRGVNCDPSKEYDDSASTFILEDGASISNVIFGTKQISGVFCLGSCTLTNVWFRSVCDEAVQVYGKGNALIVGGGANNAPNKFVQHDGSGTVTIRGGEYYGISHLYRSCGNCPNNKEHSPRQVIIQNNKIHNVKNDVAGINPNFGDTAQIENNCGENIASICQPYTGMEGSSHGRSLKSTNKNSCHGGQGMATKFPACS